MRQMQVSAAAPFASSSTCFAAIAPVLPACPRAVQVAAAGPGTFAHLANSHVVTRPAPIGSISQDCPKARSFSITFATQAPLLPLPNFTIDRQVSTAAEVAIALVDFREGRQAPTPSVRCALHNHASAPLHASITNCRAPAPVRPLANDAINRMILSTAGWRMVAKLGIARTQLFRCTGAPTAMSQTKVFHGPSSFLHTIAVIAARTPGAPLSKNAVTVRNAGGRNFTDSCFGAQARWEVAAFTCRFGHLSRSESCSSVTGDGTWRPV